MGLGIFLRSCPPIQAAPESPPLLRYNRYPTPSLVVLRGVCSPLALQTKHEGSSKIQGARTGLFKTNSSQLDLSLTRRPIRLGCLV